MFARSVLEDVDTQMSHSRPNGVVLEPSSYDEADINAQRVSAIRQLVARLNVARLNVAEPDATEAHYEIF